VIASVVVSTHSACRLLLRRPARVRQSGKSASSAAPTRPTARVAPAASTASSTSSTIPTACKPPPSPPLSLARTLLLRLALAPFEGIRMAGPGRVSHNDRSKQTRNSRRKDFRSKGHSRLQTSSPRIARTRVNPPQPPTIISCASRVFGTHLHALSLGGAAFHWVAEWALTKEFQWTLLGARGTVGDGHARLACSPTTGVSHAKTPNSAYPVSFRTLPSPAQALPRVLSMDRAILCCVMSACARRSLRRTLRRRSACAASHGGAAGTSTCKAHCNSTQHIDRPPTL